MLYAFIGVLPILLHSMEITRKIGETPRLGVVFNLILNMIEGDKLTNRPNKIDREYPTIPYDFECYVCGSTFKTNQDRLQHLEEVKHLDLYNTASPQEREEISRLSETT